jgi:sigma-B regulation protein RsbU (phosphoserine phosphatase)
MTTTPPVSDAGADGPPPRSWFDWSFRTRLVAGVCGLVLLTGATVTWLAHKSAQASTEALAHSLFREVSSHAVTHTRAFVFRAAPLAQALRHLADHGLALDDTDRLARQLLAFFEANPGMSWVSYGDEAGTFTGIHRLPDGSLRINRSRIVDGHTHLVEHSVLADGSWQEALRDDDSGYDPRQRPYYKMARQKNRLVWLPPYVFYNQAIPGVSCAIPLHDKAGRLRGVFSIDFDLKDLSDFVAGLSVGENSRVFLFTADQVLIAHPDQRKVGVIGQRAEGKLLTLADVNDPLVAAFRQELRPEDVQAPGGETFRFFQLRHAGTDYLASTTAFQLGQDQVWVVGAVAPKSDFFADVWRSQAVALAACALALVGAVVLAALMARRVSRPVLALIGFMRKVGSGDLETRADFGGGREFRQLSSALNRMIGDLRDRLRLRHSLEVAMEVQQRLLPQRAPKVRGLDIAGHSTYCDETGGDYYDFLVLDEAAPDSVLLALGDVMGHGVAAALVMAGARAVLRDRVDAKGALAELMGRLNRLLAADHAGTRFMTMHLSVANSSTGTFRWVSAGHDPALIFDSLADAFEEIDAGDLPLGIMDDTQYQEHAYGPLKPGQVIFIGTDGVWECPNEAGEQFGKPRLREAIRAAARASATDIVQAILDRLLAFRGQCRPVDDVTFVVVKIEAIVPTASLRG